MTNQTTTPISTIDTIRAAEKNIAALAAGIPPGPLTPTTRPAFHKALDLLGIGLTSGIAHQAAANMDDTTHAGEVKHVLDLALELTRNNRDFWVQRALGPWCERHGLTLRQGLSAMFQDDAYNPENPSEDLVTAKDLFGWGGQQNEFAQRLILELDHVQEPTPSTPAPGLCLVVLSSGGVMEKYGSGTAPWEAIETIDCQNGDAGHVYSFAEKWRTVINNAFGEGQWPRYVRISAHDEIDVTIKLEDDAGRYIRTQGIWSDSRGELLVTGLVREEGFAPQFNRITNVRFTDGRPPITLPSGVVMDDEVDGISTVTIHTLGPSEADQEQAAQVTEGPST